MTGPTFITAVQVANIGNSGTIVAFGSTDAANGNEYIQDGNTILRLNNTDASSHTVTFTYPVLVDGQTVPSKVLTLAASEVRYIAAALTATDKQLYPGGGVTFTSNSALVKYELVTHV